MTDHRQNPPAYSRRDGGGETKKGELEENTGAKTRETNIKTLPQATIVAEGRDKGENQHEMERWHSPQSREGGEVPSRKRISKEKTKQRASQRKEDKTHSPVLLLGVGLEAIFSQKYGRSIRLVCSNK